VIPYKFTSLENFHMATAKKGASKNMGAKVAVGVGLGLAAAAGAAGYYFYGAKDAAKHRAKTAKWAKGFEADVMKHVKKAKNMDEKAYRAIVAEVSKAYETVKGVDKKDLARAEAGKRSSEKGREGGKEGRCCSQARGKESRCCRESRSEEGSCKEEGKKVISLILPKNTRSLDGVFFFFASIQQN